MTDRQDIDALLIGSLYGELSSTEEARLTAHLESHPQDRTALADLTWARDAVRESRILQMQFEPPQSISALLLQEAHRRAPKPQEERSWFQRFMRSFMLHPAMAAAAMLVLIVGVAGTLYVRQGDHFANQTKSEAPAAETADTAETPASPSVVAGAAGVDAGAQIAQQDNFAVRLDDLATGKQSEQAPLADKNLEAQKKQKRKPTELAFEGNLAKEAKPEPKVANKPAPKKPAARPYLEVTTPDRAPKDMDAPKTTVARGDAVKVEQSRTTTLGTGAAGGAPSPAPGAVAPAQPQPPPAEAEKKPDPLLAWAQQQHARVIAQVKAGKCDVAANIALQIANRASAYYVTNVENDIAIKPCKPLIANLREKEAERVQRAKATQRRSADEPAKATAPTSK